MLRECPAAGCGNFRWPLIQQQWQRRKANTASSNFYIAEKSILTPFDTARSPVRK